ncbi:alpha/beta hydrolase [Paraconexibacter sp.]|uniref:alpha/beta hydrolase n=1 Tax=Paraconexibacter sp. TaxID=2949640 RepID=UPI003568BC3F
MAVDPAPSARLHPQVQAVRVPDLDGPIDLDALRAGYAETARRLGGPVQDVAHVQNLRIPRGAGEADQDPVPARYYLPASFAPGPAGVLVWLHGGGWIIGDLDGIDPACRAICNASGHAVLSVDYRLAPEHPFPAGLEDAWHAVLWAAGDSGAEMLDIEPGRVVVGGDSAGGNLAAAVARRARDAGVDLHGQVLVYPALDPTRDSSSYREFADGPFLSRDEMGLAWSTYVGADATERASDPDLAPLAAQSFAGLPAAHIALAEIDPLHDDGVRYASALADAGVPVTVTTHPGMAHGFLRWAGAVDEAAVALRAVGAAAGAFLGA